MSVDERLRLIGSTLRRVSSEILYAEGRIDRADCNLGLELARATLEALQRDVARVRQLVQEDYVMRDPPTPPPEPAADADAGADATGPAADSADTTAAAPTTE